MSIRQTSSQQTHTQQALAVGGDYISGTLLHGLFIVGCELERSIHVYDFVSNEKKGGQRTRIFKPNGSIIEYLTFWGNATALNRRAVLQIK